MPGKNHYNGAGITQPRDTSNRLNMSVEERLHDIIHAFVDLADERMGTRALYCTDDFFAPMENLLKPAEPVHRPGEFTEHGKWMDGWESRRRRSGGHDHCIVRFGVSGIIKAVDIDTRFFTGNYPAQASLDACYSDKPPDETTQWTEIIPSPAWKAIPITCSIPMTPISGLTPV